MNRRGRGRSDQGSALVSAIAFSAMFGVIAVLSIQIVLNAAFRSRDIETDIQRHAAERTAVFEALRRLTQLNEPFRYGDRIEIETASGVYSVTVFAPTGLVDLNAASPIVMSRILEAAGAGNPSSLAAAIADWRDPDDLRANDGAEAAEYRDAGLTGPANAVFQTEREVEGVLGMTPDVFACLLPHLTVSTHASAPDLQRAPAWVRSAMRTGLQTDAPDELRFPQVNLGTGDLIGLDVAHHGASGEPFLRVLLRLSGERDNPVWIQAWDRMPPTPERCRDAGDHA